MKKELNKSIDLPREMQFGENWGWEESLQRYQLDREFQKKSYFTDMDPEDFLHLIRKLDNFLMERGISEYFIRNFALACEVFDEMDKDDNDHHKSDTYYE